MHEPENGFLESFPIQVCLLTSTTPTVHPDDQYYSCSCKQRQKKRSLTHPQEKVSQRAHSKHIYLNSIEIVNSQNCAPLVFIAQETESFGFPNLLVSHKINVDNLSILWEHTDDIAFCQFIRKPSNKDPGAVLVFECQDTFCATPSWTSRSFSSFISFTLVRGFIFASSSCSLQTTTTSGWGSKALPRPEHPAPHVLLKQFLVCDPKDSRKFQFFPYIREKI